MKAKEIYLEIATRYTQSAKQQIANAIEIQEVIGFTAYHALESIACSVIVHFKSSIPINHQVQLNMFMMLCRKHWSSRINVREVAKIIMRFNNYGYREKFLYPDYQPDGNYLAPTDQFTMTEVRLLIRDVDRIINQILSLVE